MRYRLVCNNCILRPLSFADVDSISSLANNINIWKNVSDGFPYPYTHAHAIEFIKAIRKTNPPQDFAIEFENMAVGIISLTPNVGIYRIKAEIGYWIGEPYWGKGLTSEAIRRIVKYGFNTFDIVKIEAKTYDFNKASEKVLLNSGFTKLASLPQDAVKDNKVLNLNYFYLLKEQFLKWEDKY